MDNMTYKYTEDDLLPISALQHLMFCERQCALIHVENLWQENRLTVEGRILHENVHEQDAESRGELRVARGLRLRSLDLGLTGVADVVELWGKAAVSDEDALSKQKIVPVEYKRGRPKPDECDKVQLCAQAMCLEEMMHMHVEEGAIFYGKPRRRLVVALTVGLRDLVRSSSDRLHELVESGQTPPAFYEKKCKSCSLFELCMPATAASGKSVARYMGQMLMQ